jgi:hypothetical protein
MIPAFQKCQSAADRHEQNHRNLQVAFALAAYHKDNGKYPVMLDDLAPKYLAVVPGDLFAGTSLTYKLEGNGYLFFSVGPNANSSDWERYDEFPPYHYPQVRMPLPELKPKR